MKVGLYNTIVNAQMSRRRMLQGATALSAMAMVPLSARMASAQDNVRAEILKIPGVGMGSPTDADWQKVGEMCLGATKTNVAEGEFAGVELTFLKGWETYTGAKINWIDLAQADYNPRLQQSIATGTVDFDILAMGAPLEGDTASKGLLDEMPDWVAAQIEMDDYVNYLKAPVGTWDGKTYRISIDGDCHTFAFRKDYFGNDSISGMAEAPSHWEDVNAMSLAVMGKTDPLTGTPAFGFLDPLKGWGGFGFYFLRNFAQALGDSGQIPILLAAWSPPVAAVMLSLGLLLHLEEG